MKSFFNAAQLAVNGFQQELTKVAYSATKAEETMLQFMNHEYIELRERLDKLETRAGSHDLAIQDFFNQLIIKQ
jgi:hypothetical protein